MPLIKVSYEGKEIEVEQPSGVFTQEQVDESYLPRATVKDQYVLQTEFDKRFKNWVPKAKAAEDPEVIGTVLKANPPKDQPEGLEEHRAKWEETDLKPKVEQLEQLQARLTRSAVSNAAAKYFADEYSKPPKEGQPSYMETLFDGRIKFDTDLGYPVALDEAGKPIPALQPTNTRPYAGADEFYGSIAKDETYKRFLKPGEQNNDSRYQGGKGGEGASATSGKKRSEMTPQEKAALVAEIGNEAYLNLPY